MGAGAEFETASVTPAEMIRLLGERWQTPTAADAPTVPPK